MNYHNPAIIVVAFNRPRSLKRLIKSLEKAVYDVSDINLIFSIDKAPDNDNVKKIADHFQWKHGTKKVVYQSENLGLKKHIVKCMRYSLEFKSIILLEDDLFVAPGFYNYSVQALQFTSGDEKIGGISLYNHCFNVHKGVNFSALEDGYDNWYFQFASSWGQAWSDEHIVPFLQWFDSAPDLEKNDSLPQNVLNWSSKSWLKFFISYLIETDKYFLYPKVSQSTNFSDSGTHIQNDNTGYQVPLSLAASKNYNFSSLDESKAVYDAFFENSKLHEFLGLNEKEVSIDLYGYRKKFSTKYIVSSAIMDFKILRSFGKSLKPVDGNVVFDIQGKDFFLYDSTIAEKNQLRPARYKDIMYQVKHLDHWSTALLFYETTKKRVIHNFKKLSK